MAANAIPLLNVSSDRSSPPGRGRTFQNLHITVFVCICLLVLSVFLYFIGNHTRDARPAEKQAAPPRPVKLTNPAGRSGAKLTADSIDGSFSFCQAV